MRQNPNPVDQNAERLHAIQQWIRTRRGLVVRSGAVVAGWRSYGGRRLGPYFRLAYREHGRQRSIYLGRSKELAAAVRRLLEGLRRPLRRHTAWLRARGVLAAELRGQKRVWEVELRRRGLYTRGYAVRGWRRLGARPLCLAARLVGQAAGVAHLVQRLVSNDHATSGESMCLQH